MDEVQNKWDTLKLNDDIWAKLIYFEQNRRLAKAYVSAPVLTIDGSANGLDGFRIGLSGIDNTYRNLDSVGCLRSIGQGVKLKIDSQGNILIRRIKAQAGGGTTATTTTTAPPSSRCSVWIRDWPSQQGRDENCTMREIEQSDTSYKLFDMRRFRHYLERRRITDAGGKLDWRQCVSIISFVRRQRTAAGSPSEILNDPCWIMIINIIAIDMIKSIICDERNLPIGGGQRLVSHHGLLNGHSNQKTSPHESHNVAARSRRSSLKTSSSTSVLYQPNATSAPSGVVTNEPEPEQPINGLSAMANGRAKKARTSVATRIHQRPSSLARDPHYRRQYQSSQQLSSNNNNSNVIYTTFNSKYINHPRAGKNHQAYELSTSDYYSGSRSSTTTNGYRTNNNNNNSNTGPSRHGASVYSAASSSQSGSRRQAGYLMTRPNQIGPRDDGSKKGPFARGEFVRQLEHNRSLSSFDLTLQKFDFKPIQSAIRMNYDEHLSESEDFYEQDEPAAAAAGAAGIENINHSSETTVSGETNNKTTLFATERSHLGSSQSNANSSDSGVVNHNECQAMHNSSVAVDTTVSQEMSRSSLTSSSSSGCADNDYFMSHSSSSMSEASNERELSSQPASSSGIACSGTTSDEYDDGNRKPAGAAASASSPATESPSRLTSHANQPTGQNRTKELDTEPLGCGENKKTSATHKSKSHRRGYRIKTICEQLQDDHHQAQDDCGFVCGCEPAAYDCDCCCDCLIGDHHGFVAPLELGCGCDCPDTESIYDCLPAPRKSLQAARNKSTTANQLQPQSDITNSSKLTTNTTKSDPSEKLSSRADSSSPRSPAGWLEKRKYSRIFPKFIFSSSNSSRRLAVSDDNASANTKGTQRKSQTLDNRQEERFRLTRSTQDLS